MMTFSPLIARALASMRVHTPFGRVLMPRKVGV
jgi:hypothetical protein